MGYMGSHIEHEAAYEAAIKRNIINNAKKTFAKKFPEAAAYLDGVIYSHVDENGVAVYRNEFIKSLIVAYETYGKLTEKQVIALNNSIARAAERRAANLLRIEDEKSKSNYVGEVGKPVQGVFNVKKIIEIEGARFSYYDNGISYLSILDDGNGNCVVYKGKKILAEEGEAIKLKASVKEQKIYNGGKQTVIQRPRLLSDYVCYLKENPNV